VRPPTNAAPRRMFRGRMLRCDGRMPGRIEVDLSWCTQRALLSR